MRAVSFVICVVFLCFMDNVYGTLGEFLGDLPSEIGNAFSNAWYSIKEAIKTPVKIKRLGPGGRKKTTTIRPTTIGTTIMHWIEEPTYPVKNENKLKLPLLPTPRWRSFREWHELQKPRYIQMRRVNNDTVVEKVRYKSTRQPGGFTYDDWRRMQRTFYRRSRRAYATTPAVYPAPGDTRNAKAEADQEHFGVLMFV